MRKEPQHYRLSLEKAKQDYKDGIITATGLVYYSVGIYRRPGQKLRVKDIDAFCKDMGISRAAFYKAISKLKMKDRLDWEAIAGLNLWIPDSNVVEIGSPSQVSTNVETLSTNVETLSTNVETLSTNVETLSTNVETLSTNVETLSTNVDKEALEPSPNKGSSPSSTIFHIFLNSLSIEERESFLKFAQEKAKAMPNPPQLVGAWIAKHHADLHKQFIGSAADKEAKKEAIASSKDWRNDPRFDEWIKASFERSYEWVEEDKAEQEERSSFHRWAQKVNAYEGVCY